QEGFSFHPSEVTTALCGGHRLRDLEEVSEHHPLAFRAQARGLTQSSVNLRGRVRRAREEFLQPAILRLDLTALLPALREVGCMKFRHSLELGVAQVELPP